LLFPVVLAVINIYCGKGGLLPLLSCIEKLRAYFLRPHEIGKTHDVVRINIRLQVSGDINMTAGAPQGFSGLQDLYGIAAGYGNKVVLH